MKKTDALNTQKLKTQVLDSSQQMEALSIIPSKTRERMIKEIIDHNILGLVAENKECTVPPTVFLKCYTVICQYTEMKGWPDPLELARQEYALKKLGDESTWFSSPNIDVEIFRSHEGLYDPVFAFFEKSRFFDLFLKGIGASDDDGEIIRTFVSFYAAGNINGLGDITLPACFLKPSAAKDFIIYSRAAAIELQQLSVTPHNLVESLNVISILLDIYKKLKGKFSDEIEQWKYYWHDQHNEAFSLGFFFMSLNGIGFNPASPKNEVVSFEYLLFTILYLGTISENWRTYIFDYVLSHDCKTVYERMLLARLTDIHPYGNDFKLFYLEYCRNTGLQPIIKIDSSVQYDRSGEDEKLWISPTINGLSRLDFPKRLEKIDKLFDMLNEWGAFGQDDYSNVKSLFRYRFSGCKPRFEKDDIIPWVKDKTSLAILCQTLLENYEGKKPYARIARFFENGDKLNVSAFNPTGDSVDFQKRIREVLS